MRFFKLAHNQSERKCWIVRLPQRPGFLSFCPSSTNREYSFIPHAAAKPPGIAKAPREESWVAFVGMLMFPIPESAKFLTLVLGQSIFRTSTWVGCSASLLLCRVVCFPSFSFLWVQMLLLVLWVLVHYWSKHRACTNNTWTEFYGREKLTVVRRWLVSIFTAKHLGSFHRHHLKMLPVPLYLRNNLCLKLIISQLLIFFSLMLLLEAVFLHSG